MFVCLGWGLEQYRHLINIQAPTCPCFPSRQEEAQVGYNREDWEYETIFSTQNP